MCDEKKRIMVVDDDKVLLKNAAVLLGVNYSVSLYSGGTEALKALSEKALPDLILLDVKMPDIDGYTVIQRINEIPRCKNIPIIFVTGMSDEEDELKGFQLGAADYIKKPFSQKILLARISNLLRKSEPAASSAELITADFNDTERKVAELIVQGYSGKEICDKLFYSYSYIKKLLASMREKCGCETLGDLKKILCGSFEQKK